MENRTIKIFIDDGSLEKTLARDQKLMEQIAQKQEKLRQGTKQWNELEEKRQATLKRIDTTQQQLNKTMGLTMEQLRRKSQELNKELNKIPIELRASSQAAANLKIIQAEMAKVKAETQATESAMQRMRNRIGGITDGFNKYSNIAITLAATLTGVVLGFRKLIDNFYDFEDGLNNLSALTGLEGENLQWLGQQAQDLGTKVTENGGRITQSATEILEAFTLMGSNKPELLQSKEALASVTEQALILAGAAKIEAAAAVDALALTMNQFNAPANEAGRYINVLAAGSKVGAANVEQINASMLKAGSAFKSANVSVEEAVGLIETLAERGQKGEIAGTGLKNMMIKLQTQTNQNFNPAIVGVNQAFENLAKANLSATELTKMFGMENYTTAKILIDNHKAIDGYTKAVTDTNTAYEQHLKNTSGGRAALAQARNDFMNQAMVLGERLAPMLAFSTNLFTQLVKLLLQLPQFWQDNKVAIMAFTAALIAYRSQQILATASTVARMATEKAQLLMTGALTVAQKGLNTVMRANPIGFVFSLIAALTGVFAVLYQRSEKVRAAVAGVWEVLKFLGQTIKDGVLKIFEGLGDVITGIFTLDTDKIKAGIKKAAQGVVDSNIITSVYKNGSKIAEAYNKGFDNKMKEEEEKRKNAKKKETIPGLTGTPVVTDFTPPPNPTEEDDKVAKAKENYQKLIDANDKFIKDLHAKQLTGLQKELEQERLKFDEKIKELEDFKTKEGALLNNEQKKEIDDKVIELTKEQEAALQAIKVRYAKETNEKIEQLRLGLNLELKSAQQLEIEQVQAKYKKLIEEAKEHGLDLTELHNLQKAEEDRINKKYDEIEEADQAAKEEKDRQKRQQKIQDIVRGAQQLTQALTDGISQIRAQFRQQELDADLATINQAAQASLSALDERHKAELSRTGLSERSKAQLERKYQAEKAAIEKKHREEERRLKLKDWKANQQAAITQALINGALAITNILATRPKNDFGIGDAIMIAAAGVTTASQVALISGKKPPQFKYGGIPKGPSHSQGGIKLVSNGQAIAEMEGGEPIISRQTYANNKPVVDALLYSGLYRNGASINYPRFGIQPRLNFSRVQAANRPRYQQGGIAPTVTANNTTPADPANTELLTQLQSLMQQNQALLMQLNQRLAQPLTAVTIIGHKQADEIQELMEENQRISQSNGF